MHWQVTNSAIADHLVKLSTRNFDHKEACYEFEHQPTREVVFEVLQAGESSCCSVDAGSSKVLQLINSIHVNCGLFLICVEHSHSSAMWSTTFRFRFGRKSSYPFLSFEPLMIFSSAFFWLKGAYQAWQLAGSELSSNRTCNTFPSSCLNNSPADLQVGLCVCLTDR